MAFYVQYDEDGNISATVSTAGPAPACARQLAFDDWVQVQGKCVNLATLALEDAPAE